MSPRTAAKVYLVLLPLHLCAALAIRGRTPGDPPFFAEFSEAETERILSYVEPMAAAREANKGLGGDEALASVCEVWRYAAQEGRLKTIVPLEIGARSQVSPVDEINQTVGSLLRKIELAAQRAEHRGDKRQASEWALIGLEIAGINRESSFLTLRRSFDYEARFAPILARLVPELDPGQRKDCVQRASNLAAKSTDVGSVALRMGLRQSKQLMAEGELGEREKLVKKYRALSTATATYDIDGLSAIAHGGSTSEAALELRLAANTAKVALASKA
ncbi:MAG: hypothetical protein AB7T05_06620, partial [Fimbriimonadaceae bacterium]